MPRSKSHTSQRLGVVFLSFKLAQKLIGSQDRFAIVQRTGIKWRCPTQELHCENPLFLFGQSFEGFQELGSLLAHVTSLPSLRTGRQVHRPPVDQGRWARCYRNQRCLAFQVLPGPRLTRSKIESHLARGIRNQAVAARIILPKLSTDFAAPAVYAPC